MLGASFLLWTDVAGVGALAAGYNIQNNLKIAIITSYFLYYHHFNAHLIIFCYIWQLVVSTMRLLLHL